MIKDPKKAESAGKLDTKRIPQHVRMTLAKTAYSAILQDLQRPEFKAGYQQWKAERAAAGAQT